MQVEHEPYAVLAREVVPVLAELTACRSEAELAAHPAYRSIEPVVRQVLATPHIADFRSHTAAPRARYRFVAWNIERGTHFEAQLEALRKHPYLKECDVLMLTEADVGMARSRNRSVAEELARGLEMSYVFAPCYIALGKGSGVERDVTESNHLGLHGNAILSRYPIRDVRLIPLENGVDKMAHREQRLGCQTAVAAHVELPGMPLDVVSIHLDAQARRTHRRDQMETVLATLQPDTPAILGGDWNTSTYDTSTAFRAIVDFWIRVCMGVDYVIRCHYLHPERFFERPLFRLLESHGFEFRQSNRLGERTTSYDVCDAAHMRNLNEWVPEWCFQFIRWSLRNHGGVCPWKLDWFATRGVRVQNPMVVHELREARSVPLSDHDPLGVDVLVE
jgi:endonuclease/exonuclease/phosphatase family metal-dependent hydrolase